MNFNSKIIMKHGDRCHKYYPYMNNGAQSKSEMGILMFLKVEHKCAYNLELTKNCQFG